MNFDEDDDRGALTDDVAFVLESVEQLAATEDDVDVVLLAAGDTLASVLMLALLLVEKDTADVNADKDDVTDGGDEGSWGGGVSTPAELLLPVLLMLEDGEDEER